MEADVVVFEDPWRQSQFRSINFRKFDLPLGVSAMQFLRRELAPLPKGCFPQAGDAAENEMQTVIRLDDLDYESEVMIRAPITSITAVGDTATPGVVVVDRNNVVYEPDGEDNFLRPTTTRMVPTEGDTPTHMSVKMSEWSETKRMERQYQMLMPEFSSCATAV